MKIWIVMGNDFPDDKAFVDEATANAYIAEKKATDLERWKKENPGREPLTPRIYWRSYEAELVGAPISRAGRPSVMQTYILRVLVDKDRTYEQISGKIAAVFGTRYAVSSIHASISGMINRSQRHWVMEHVDAKHVKRISITQNGRKVLELIEDMG